MLVPANYQGRRVWLNFDGINYSAEIWVNGRRAGSMRGAFSRGRFDISDYVKPGRQAVVGVRVSPQPNPGIPHEHTLAHGMGPNGGITAIEGPTFLCSIGWDWIPAIRDRNTGIWQKVYLSATGDVVVKDPLVTTDLDLPDLGHAALSVRASVQNVADRPVKGVLKGKIGNIVFQQTLTLQASSSKTISFTPATFPQLRIKNPRLWWPNGYGEQNLYRLQLSFEQNGTISDRQELSFGIREMSYHVSDSENLTVSVNGVRIFCKGGNWGMDEAMKRIPHSRLEAQIRMHKLANYTMIRNWVGQSTSDEFYELCDKYGIMLWDEFFQPNPSDGPNPTDLNTYIYNVREKILRYRNHPSIAIWCARNEGYPPEEIDRALQQLMKELDPTRLYQPSSTEGRGVNSEGPYFWRKPVDYYTFDEAFKTETGSLSVPTLESIRGMMPQKDWEVINDDWAEHDFADGAQRGDSYRKEIESRYGQVLNLADFVRKAQLANYEAYRAMYEGRNATLFKPSTGVLTWMSNPAQPSFVWQLYHHDLEPNSSLFATRIACQAVHIQFNEKDEKVQVINNLPSALTNAHATLRIYNLDGSLRLNQSIPIENAAPSEATDLDAVRWPSGLSSVYFIKLELRDSLGRILSDNFYWRAQASHRDELGDLGKLKTVTLEPKIESRRRGTTRYIYVTLHNPGSQVALMTHLQLRRSNTGERILPVYYSDNYISLVPGETRTVTIEASLADLQGSKPLVLIDGWNIKVKPLSSATADLKLNNDAQVDPAKATGLPLYYGEPKSAYKVNCGGSPIPGYDSDEKYSAVNTTIESNPIDVSAEGAAPEKIYQTARYDRMMYTFPMAVPADGKTYSVKLHFCETEEVQAGSRTISALINGKNVLRNYDIVKEAGRFRAVIKQFDGITPDEGGNIRILIVKGKGEKMPLINAIEIK